MEFVDLGLMFNDTYAYRGSMSKTMRDHFKHVSEEIKREFNPKSILEIGSNDGVFIKNFSQEISTAVEPCGNFSEGGNSYTKFGAALGSSNITNKTYLGLLAGNSDTNVFNLAFDLYFNAVPVFPATS